MVDENVITALTKRVEDLEKLVKSHLGSRVPVGSGTPHPELSNAGKVYTITNRTTDRTFDADSTSTAELADVLGTLILDLQEVKIIG